MENDAPSGIEQIYDTIAVGMVSLTALMCVLVLVVIIVVPPSPGDAAASAPDTPTPFLLPSETPTLRGPTQDLSDVGTDGEGPVTGTQESGEGSGPVISTVTPPPGALTATAQVSTPVTPSADATQTSTAVAEVTLTPTPTDAADAPTLTPTPDEPTNTPDPDATPTATPALITPTPDQETDVIFELDNDATAFQANPEGNGGCTRTVIAGEVLDFAGRPATDVVIRLTGDGIEETTTSGTAPDYGGSGWEFIIEGEPETATYFVQMLDDDGDPISQEIRLTFNPSCESNRALLIFREVLS